MESQRRHRSPLTIRAMTAPILSAIATFGIAATAIHIASLTIAIRRFRRRACGTALSAQYPPVSLVHPLCGLDNYVADTLRSTFRLDYPCYEILFCVASADDPVISLARRLIAENPAIKAQLLIGDDRVSGNPKLNNIAKGWRAAAHEWVIITDSNVLIPSDYVQRLLSAWRADTGLVASPPIGSCPRGFWAELECAFLNTYQARWQYCVDAFGRGFAQGKTMLWRRADLDHAGGIAALGKETAEDAAATKIVRDAGLKVRLIDRPVAQPLGRRSAAEVWNRQLRWARLRRASFLVYFLPEILSGSLAPMIGIGILASAYGLSVIETVTVFGALWYVGEMLLARAAGWHVTAYYPLCGLARDLLLPALYVGAFMSNDFVWRGNAMQVERMAPRRMRSLAGRA
jgi:ceramide glucosyltransferase